MHLYRHASDRNANKTCGLVWSGGSGGAASCAVVSLGSWYFARILLAASAEIRCLEQTSNTSRRNACETDTSIQFARGNQMKRICSRENPWIPIDWCALVCGPEREKTRRRRSALESDSKNRAHFCSAPVSLISIEGNVSETDTYVACVLQPEKKNAPFISCYHTQIAHRMHFL